MLLTSWTLKNFKSFREAQTVELSAINIFTGANSSGKSSIVQSLLLLKQTLRYGSKNRSLVLNGPLLKLGTFDDIRNDGAAGAAVSFKWNFSTEAKRWVHKAPSLRPPWWSHANMYSVSAAQIESISGELEWALKATDRGRPQDDQTDLLYPPLQKGNLSCTASSYELPLAVAASNWTYRWRNDDQPLPLPPGAGASFGEPAYEAQLDAVSVSELGEGRPKAKVIATLLRHFFPAYAVIGFDGRARAAAAIASFVVGEGSSVALRRAGLDANTAAPPGIAKVCEDWVRQFNAEFELNSATYAELRELVRQATRPSLVADSRDGRRPARMRASEKEVRRSELAQNIHSAVIESMPVSHMLELDAPTSLRSAEQIFHAFVKDGIKYLGPLRDEPRHVYPVEVLEDPSEVGYKGEHTAAVLDLNASQNVWYIPSANMKALNFQPKRATLQDAVNDWSSYMGVAAKVVTRDQGVFGHQLKVETDSGRRHRDLTNVGVGVSQVLPILVMSLLAPVGSTLVFEQPELHLHPKVQARLADFFFATAFLDKQCILETHSEYLIDRLRLRIAQAEGRTLSDLVAVYFVEREEGQSKCRKVDISEFGAVLDWPADFFDQSQNEAEAILRAASLKGRS